jgi:hypothetical protein
MYQQVDFSIIIMFLLYTPCLHNSIIHTKPIYFIVMYKHLSNHCTKIRNVRAKTTLIFVLLHRLDSIKYKIHITLFT